MALPMNPETADKRKKGRPRGGETLLLTEQIQYLSISSNEDDAKSKKEQPGTKEATGILVKSSPKAAFRNHPMQLRSQSKKITFNTISPDSKVETITVYPPPPAEGGIAINTEDFKSLADGEMLTDAIMDFYLQYIKHEVLSLTDHDRTHVFSSYFYKFLTSSHLQAEGNAENASIADRRYARVQEWTETVNIFDKDFIFVPVNEKIHWFLAIICFPGLIGEITSKLETESLREKLAEKKKSNAKNQTSNDEDESEMSESKVNTEQAAATVPQPVQQIEKTKKVPCILILDSLGHSRVRVITNLRDYLKCEYKAKMGVEKEFSKDTIKGTHLKVPQQPNSTDCGLYLLQYVESFFKTPITDYTLPIKTLENWFEEIVVTRKREEIATLLLNLATNPKIILPNLVFPTIDGKLKYQPEKNHHRNKRDQTEFYV